jgi:hypothetical protein
MRDVGREVGGHTRRPLLAGRARRRGGNAVGLDRERVTPAPTGPAPGRILGKRRTASSASRRRPRKPRAPDVCPGGGSTPSEIAAPVVDFVRDESAAGVVIECIGGRAPRRFDPLMAGLTTATRSQDCALVLTDDPGFETCLLAGAEGFQDRTRDSTAIADRIAIHTRPLAHCGRVQGSAASAMGLRRSRLVSALRGRAGSANSATRSQPPPCSGQLIEMGLA